MALHATITPLKREYGLRLDWVSATTVKVQPGGVVSDDGTYLELAAALSITFADIDTGAEGSSSGYYVWLYDDGAGGVAGALSLSATAPTGISTGKAPVGWVFNDSGSDILAFRSERCGEHLDVLWDTALYTDHRVVTATNPVATSLTEVDCSTGGHCPAALVVGLHLDVERCTQTWNLHLSTNASASVSRFSGDGNNDNNGAPYVASQGASFWYKFDGQNAADVLHINVRGFRFDRSGVTYG